MIESNWVAVSAGGAGMLLGGSSIGIRIGMIRKKQPCEDQGELNCRQNKQLG